jgi:hypothetical protein
VLKTTYHSPRYNYDTNFSCEESGCNDEGICRCGRISNAVVESVDLTRLTDEIWLQFTPDTEKQRRRENKIAQLLYGGETVDKYCIYRILVINKVYETSNWEVIVTGGYYGDEIESVEIDHFLAEKISEQCDHLFTLSTLADKLKFVLKLDYGYILEDIQGHDFELISIYKSEIDFKKLNQNHINLCKIEPLDFYYESQYNLPRGIIRGTTDDYRIIDGFHRILAAKDRSKFEVFLLK